MGAFGTTNQLLAGLTLLMATLVEAPRKASVVLDSALFMMGSTLVSAVINQAILNWSGADYLGWGGYCIASLGNSWLSKPSWR